MTRRQWSRAAGLVTFVCVMLAIAVYLLGRVGTSVISSGDDFSFEADVTSSYALTTAADVRESGVLVGRVSAIKQAGTITALDLSIFPQYRTIYQNATVLIRAKSVADESYVQLTPGTPSAGLLATNAVLGVTREQQAVQDDDVFSILEARQRAGLQQAVQGIGHGLEGEGGENLNESLEAMTALVDDGQSFAQILDQERRQTAGLLSSFDGVAAALGHRAADIQLLTRAALVTSRAVAARDADLRATLAALPAFLAQARTTASRLGRFSERSTPVFANLRVAFDDLVPAVDALKPAADEAATTLAELDTFARVALPTFVRLSPFAGTIANLVRPYAVFLRQLSPLSRFVSPYFREVGSWFSNAGAAVDATDSISHVARIILPISRSNYPTVVSGPEATLLAKLSGGLDTRGTDAYPNPGTAATPAPLGKTIPPVDADPAYNAKPPKPLK